MAGKVASILVLLLVVMVAGAHLAAAAGRGDVIGGVPIMDYETAIACSKLWSSCPATGSSKGPSKSCCDVAGQIAMSRLCKCTAFLPQWAFQFAQDDAKVCHLNLVC